MGTTVEKADYAFETKDLLKTEINKINNVLDDNSTFRSYPQELFNGYLDVLNNGTDTLWSNLEKVSQTGTEAVLEGVETAPIKMVLNGNTSQDTTSGKNILPIQDGVADLNGVTLTIENGILTLNGTTTASGSFKLTNGIDTQNGGIPNANWLQEEAIENLNGKVLSFQNISGISPASSWAVRLFDNTTTYTRQYTYSQLSGDKLFDTDIRLGVMTIYLNANLTFDNFKVAIQIENGTNSTDFEKYTGGIPSPNPDYPQEVKVVKGENVVSVSGKNKFNVPEEYIVSSVISNVPTNIEAGRYIISIDSIITDGSADTSSIIFYYEDGTQYATIYLSNTNKSRTLNFKKRVTKYNIYSQNTWTASQGVIATFKKLMIRLASITDDTYVPYSKTDYPISLGTIELCKINTYKDYLFKRNGKWYKYKAIGKVVFNGSEEKWFQSGNYFRIQISNSKSGTNCRSNYFVAGNQDNQFFVYADNYLGFRYGVLNNILADWKTWLSTHNTIVYYALITPTEEEITNSTLIEQLEAISKAKSVKDKTYITQTNEELPFILDVEAIKEYSVE